MSIYIYTYTYIYICTLSSMFSALYISPNGSKCVADLPLSFAPYLRLGLFWGSSLHGVQEPEPTSITNISE